MQLAFVLAVLGFGTKVGLFPVHTWLPDAHSEAPTPVSALLSGSLLAISFYAILRFYQVSAAALGPRFPRDVLLVFGVASLLLAALYLFGQRDIKRMLAYSSVEHMGILAIGVSFGAPIALAGVLLHVLAHAAAKGNAFLGAGSWCTSSAPSGLAAMRGGLDVLPWSGPLFLLAILALGAMPPFGLFRSEFEIVEGGFASASTVTAAILIIGVTVAFFGLAATTTTRSCWSRGHRRSGRVPPRGHGARSPTARGGAESPGWSFPCSAGAWCCWSWACTRPADLTGLLARAVRELAGGADGGGTGTVLASVPALWDEADPPGGGRRPVRRPVRHRPAGRPAADRALARPGRPGDAGGAAAAHRGELPGADPAAGRGVLVRAGDP